MNKKIVLFIFIFSFLFMLVGCTQPKEEKSYFVVFDGNGGKLVRGVQKQRASSSSEIVIPTYEKEGCIFDNWYIDAELTTLYDKGNILEDDLYLYAKWITNGHTISFDSNGGSIVATITQDSNTIVIEPTNPTKEGCTFNGWYSDSSLTTPYTFTNMPSENITLYAKWIEYCTEGLLFKEKGDSGYEVTGYGGTDEVVVIPSTYNDKEVVSIGNSVFNDNWLITSISIPASVTSIDAWAFSETPCLKTVIFEKGSQLKSIGARAFYYATSLTSINLPAGVESIGADAFHYAKSLTSIIIPASVISIGECAFSHAESLISITFEEGSQLTSIGENVFEYTKSLTSIRIPASVMSIGECAFSHAESLISITFEEGSNLHLIRDEAFSNVTSLTNICIPANVWSISENAFCNTKSLKSINVDNNNKSYSSIDGVLFSRAKNVIIRYPEGNTNSTYIIPSSVTRICSWAFSGAIYLTTIDIPTGVTIIGDYTFQDARSLISIKIPAGVKNIGPSTFFGAIALTTVTFEGGSQLTKIDTLAFDSTQLKSISIPASVISIGYGAFYHAESLTNITFEEGSQLKSIGAHAFYYAKSLTSIIIPASVMSIGECAFSHAESLISITFEEGSQLTSIGRNVFEYTKSLTSINVSDDNQNYSSIDGVLFNKDKTILVKYPAGKTNKSYTIPSSVTSIAVGAFENVSLLWKIVIPAGVESIGYYAFLGNIHLTICAETKSKPSGWSSDWNPDRRSVVWGYTG